MCDIIGAARTFNCIIERTGAAVNTNSNYSGQERKTQQGGRFLMNKHIKKLLSIALAIVMLLSAIPLTSIIGNVGFLPTAEAATVTKTQVENKLDELTKSGSRYAPGKGWGRGQCWTFINTLSKRIFGTSVDSTTPRNGVSECQIELTLNNYYKVSNTLYNASAADAAALLRQAQPGDVIGYRTADHVKSGNNWGILLWSIKKPIPKFMYIMQPVAQ